MVSLKSCEYNQATINSTLATGTASYAQVWKIIIINADIKFSNIPNSDVLFVTGFPKIVMRQIHFILMVGENKETVRVRVSNDSTNSKAGLSFYFGATPSATNKSYTGSGVYLTD